MYECQDFIIKEAEEEVWRAAAKTRGRRAMRLLMENFSTFFAARIARRRNCTSIHGALYIHYTYV